MHQQSISLFLCIAVAQWFYRHEMTMTPDQKFSISPGDQIRATVHVRSPTSGYFTLINLNTDDIWTEYVFIDYTTKCTQPDAAWIATIPTAYIPTLPNFRPVVHNDLACQQGNVSHHRQWGSLIRAK
ncbi:hypothetical protein L210DRAFT_2655913 [Boletus edulis BED1]|uniref:Uncharacterized protein n=1 Tax=Boletus edulis BED1 TaxID=1328754 RepID=A0AAD4GKK4_BOLED|nr:hypothetical protein L210DRAFT_2655913 [Boletus edulis BED1]